MRRVATGAKGIPYLVTHDGRTIRYPDPLVAVHDTVVLEIKTGKIIDFIKFDTGNLAMVVGGRNMGRVGIVTHRERHAGRSQLFCSSQQSKSNSCGVLRNIPQQDKCHETNTVTVLLSLLLSKFQNNAEGLVFQNCCELSKFIAENENCLRHMQDIFTLIACCGWFDLKLH